MMEFDIPVKDVSADALGLCLNGPAPEAELADTVFIPVNPVSPADSAHQSIHQCDDESGQRGQPQQPGRLGGSGALNLRLRLCIIGASHVAELLDIDGTVVFREEVSCTAEQHGGAALRNTPEKTVTHAHGTYHFQVEHLRYSPEGFAAAAADLCAVFDDDWLVGTFPGEGKYHVTALFGMPQRGGWLWDTYHLYPNDYTVVHTTSTFQPTSQQNTAGVEHADF